MMDDRRINVEVELYVDRRRVPYPCIGVMNVKGAPELVAAMLRVMADDVESGRISLDPERRDPSAEWGPEDDDFESFARKYREWTPPPPPPEGQGWCDQCERLFSVDDLTSHAGFLSLCPSCRARLAEQA